MKKLLMILVTLLTTASYSFAQDYPPAQGNPETENYSFIIPRLAYASSLFKNALRQGGADQMFLHGSFLIGSSCAFGPSLTLELSGETPTTWELATKPGQATLSWAGANASAAGAKGSYTISYNALRDTFDHAVSLQDATNATALHWQSVLTALVDAIDHFDQTQQSGRRPGMVDLHQQTVSFSRGCKFETAPAFQLQSTPQIIWTINHSPNFEGDAFGLSWEMPSEACGKTGNCYGAIGIEYFSHNQGFPFNVTHITVQ